MIRQLERSPRATATAPIQQPHRHRPQNAPSRHDSQRTFLTPLSAHLGLNYSYRPGISTLWMIERLEITEWVPRRTLFNACIAIGYALVPFRFANCAAKATDETKVEIGGSTSRCTVTSASPCWIVIHARTGAYSGGLLKPGFRIDRSVLRIDIRHTRTQHQCHTCYHNTRNPIKSFHHHTLSLRTTRTKHVINTQPADPQTKARRLQPATTIGRT